MEKNLELTIRMDNDHVESWLARTNRKAPTILGAFFIILLTIKMLCGIIQT